MNNKSESFILSQFLVNKKVVIVGGSIAGCIAAVLLQRLGAEIIILERSASEFMDKGAGVTLPVSLIQQCIDLDVFDNNISYQTMNSRSFYRQNNIGAQDEVCFWNQPIQVATLHWHDIYHNLRKRIDSKSYQGLSTVSKVTLEPMVTIQTTDGKIYSADYLVAADGINSTIRTIVYPELKLQYAGYVAWRGVLDNSDAVKSLFSNKCIPYYMFTGGHLLLYPIPAQDYQQTGRLLINWVFYQSYNAQLLPNLLTDNQEQSHVYSLSSHHLKPDHIQHLHTLALHVLPKNIAQLIIKTKQPFLQAVFDGQTLVSSCSNVLFVGDAATVLRPHTASGVTKALHHNISLYQSLQQSDESVDKTIQNWQRQQYNLDTEEGLKAKKMGEALVTQAPDWNSMDAMSTNQWWTNLMSGSHWYATNSTPVSKTLFQSQLSNCSYEKISPSVELGK